MDSVMPDLVRLNMVVLDRCSSFLTLVSTILHVIFFKKS